MRHVEMLKSLRNHPGKMLTILGSEISKTHTITIFRFILVHGIMIGQIFHPIFLWFRFRHNATTIFGATSRGCDTGSKPDVAQFSRHRYRGETYIGL